MMKKNDHKRKKLHIDRQLLLKGEMVLLVAISIITVTIAWFRLQNSALVKGLELGTYGSDYIKVALKPGGQDVSTLDENARSIDINMPNFYNVEKDSQGKTLLAPGVSGELNLYITALSPNVSQCHINTECIPLFGTEDADQSTLTAEQTQMQESLKKLVKGHIQFYRNRTKDETTGTYSFNGLIGESSENDNTYATLTISLEQKVEKPVTIYWVWFYEYSDIPQEGRNRADGGCYFDMDKLKAALAVETTTGSSITVDELNSYVQQMNEEQKNLYYDYGDTRIGLNVQNIQFHIVVNALEGDGTISATEP